MIIITTTIPELLAVDCAVIAAGADSIDDAAAFLALANTIVAQARRAQSKEVVLLARAWAPCYSEDLPLAVFSNVTRFSLSLDERERLSHRAAQLGSGFYTDEPWGPLARAALNVSDWLTHDLAGCEPRSPGGTIVPRLAL